MKIKDVSVLAGSFAFLAVVAVWTIGGQLPSANRPASGVIGTALAGESLSQYASFDGSCGKEVTDSDGNTYGSVQIGSQCWMTENLRLGMQVPGSQNQGNASITGVYKYCYENDPANCDTFGALYQWHTAMRLPQFCDTGNINCPVNYPHQGICPKGWHVPTDDEWHELELALAEPHDDTNCDLAHANGNCAPAAQALKSADIWNGLAGDNSTGFNGLPSGYRDSADHQFYCSGDDECDSGHFWTATSFSASATARLAVQHNLYLEDQEVHRGNYDKTSGFGLRCIMSK